LCFGAANVFYNAYLIDLTSEDRRDSISSYGFASGYAGGIIMLILNILFVQNAEAFGLSTGFAVRLSLLAAAIWWGIFALVTFSLIKSRGALKKKPENKNIFSLGFGAVGDTFRELIKLRLTAQFLVASFCYNNGIQTVITSASVFLAQELFVARGTKQASLFAGNLSRRANFRARRRDWIRASGAHYRREKNAAAFAFCLDLHCHFRLRIFANRRAGVGDERVHWFGSRQFAGAFTLALFTDDSERTRIRLFRALRNFRTRNFARRLAGFRHRRRHYRFVSAGDFIDDRFFAVGILILLFTNTERAIHEAGNQTPEEAAGTRVENLFYEYLRYNADRFYKIFTD
jgi:UMF1 family MFS transporter